MALSSDYTAGTISVSANGTAVTGVGTAWQISGFKAGDLLFADGWFNVVASVEGNTALTLEAPWRGSAITGAAYILRRASENAAVAEQARKLITLLGGSGNLEALGGLVGSAGKVPYFTGPGTMGLLSQADITQGARYDVQVAALIDRSAYDNRDEGFAVLVGNTGDGRAAIYSRVGAAGNWSAPAYITGPAITLDITEVDEVPYGTPPEATLTPKAGGYDLAFEIPRGMIVEPGTTTTLAPGQPAAVTFVPITGGYRLDIALPKGDTGDIDGVTPFWVSRLSTDADAAAARVGLGATATGAALFTAVDEDAARDAINAAYPQEDTLDGTPGSAMIVGAFGWGAPSPIRFAGDINTILVNSIRAVSNTASNIPVSTQGVLRTEMWDNDGAGSQVFTAFASGASWVRNRASGTWGTWYRIWSAKDLIGTVSQSSGIPTGAVIESGDNSNGRYVRYADGTQICAKVLNLGTYGINNPVGPLFYGNLLTSGAYASAFASAPSVIALFRGSNGLSWGTQATDGSSSSFPDYYALSHQSYTSATTRLTLFAIGRWF